MNRYVFRSLWIVACFLAVSTFCAAQSSGSSLGEAARQGKAQKKAKIVIGDDDVAHSTDPGPLAASPDLSDSSPADADQTQAADAKSKPGAPIASKAPATELQKKIEKAKSDETAYQQAVKSGQERLAKAQNEFQRDVAREVIENNQKNVQNATERRKQLEAQQKDEQGPPKN